MLAIGVGAGSCGVVIAGSLLAVQAQTRPVAPVAQAVTVRMSESVCRLSRTSVNIGSVRIKAKNVGRSPRSFSIARRHTPFIRPGQTRALTVSFRKPGRYRYICAARAGPRSIRTGFLRVVATSAPDRVITAVGDHTSSATDREDLAVRDAVVRINPVAHLGIGDFQYDNIGTILSGYDKIWGPKPKGLYPIIYPTAGPTHDVTSCSDTRYQNYWGRPAMKIYSFDLGSWHIISLPSAATRYGCDVSGITAALKADMAASSKRCTLAFMQEPYWTRPTGKHTRENRLRPWVQALYDRNADVLLQASNHDYQRFAPQNMSDRPDASRGIRAFVLGTGGISLYPFTGTAPNVEASNDRTYGVLKMVLHPSGYEFEFVPVAGGTFTDAGSGTCH
jgi:Cupredoxin-like domain